MRAVQFEEFGGPEVLQIAEIAEPHAASKEIRIAVQACGVNALDWKIREGLLGGEPPMQMGMEASGIVDEIGSEVSGVAVGERVFGPTDAGAADYAIVTDFETIPESLDFAGAAALPVAFETAVRGLDLLGVGADQILLINGGGGAVGTATIQLARARGATVVVTASEPNHKRLRDLGALPLTYGDGLAERIARVTPDGVDRVFDMGPGGAMPDLIEIAGDGERVLTISDFEGAQSVGARTTGDPDTVRRWDLLGQAASMVRRGELSVPVQKTYSLEEVAEAERVSQAGHLSGKLILLVR